MIRDLRFHISDTRRFARSPLVILAAFAFSNALVFHAIAWLIGGTATGGKVVDGHFFLGRSGHFVEVPERLYSYSEIHGGTLPGTLAIGFCTMFLAVWLYQDKRGR
jgi:hypothetical protein